MEWISKIRKPEPTPISLIKPDGQAHFGTFESPFERFSFETFKGQARWRSLWNALRLTEWEAVEVNTAKGILLTAVYRFGIMDINLTCYFDKQKEELMVWNHMDLFLRRSKPAKNLMDSNTSRYISKKTRTEIINNYEKNQAMCQGASKNKKHGQIEFKINLNRLSKPSIVSIPVKKIYPVYTEKDMFQAVGSITVNGETEQFDTAVAVIDDHRGFYPRKSGYDWVTTFGYQTNEKEKHLFGLNLTDFINNHNPYDYNENGYWDERDFHPLPLAHFQKQGNFITIKDEHETIDLTYEKLKTHQVCLNLWLFRIDYQLHFGKLNGTIRDIHNNQIHLKDEYGLAEYRYTIL